MIEKRIDNKEMHYELRRLQMMELEIYQYFRSLCQKYNFKWFAMDGTCLGAARHKGFIPWDDDMDFGMPFEDYMSFIEIAARECEYPYYLQSYQTDPENGGITQSRIRRSDTTAYTKWEYDHIVKYYDEYPDYNLGVFIDIFPLCYVPDDDETKVVQKEQIMEVWKAIRGYAATVAIQRGHDDINPEYYNYIDIYEKYSQKYSLRDMKELYTQLCGMNKVPTRMMGETTFRTFSDNFMYDTDCFLEAEELPFEDTTILVPKGYDRVLTKKYGDWHIPVKDSGYHEIYLFDLDVSYTEKMKNIAE